MMDDSYPICGVAGRFLLGTYCHDKLGCFPTDGDFSDRVVNFRPNNRETINTKFRVNLIPVRIMPDRVE